MKASPTPKRERTTTRAGTAASTRSKRHCKRSPANLRERQPDGNANDELGNDDSGAANFFGVARKSIPCVDGARSAGSLDVPRCGVAPGALPATGCAAEWALRD